jgi:uncharacterized membrane protein YhaH (DUF805 family)
MDLGSLLFSFSGRINRAKYWLAVLIYVVVMVVIGLVLVAAFHAGGPGNIVSLLFGVIAFVVYIAMLVSGIAIGIKRLHDRDKSGWWLLIFYVLPSVIAGIGSGIGEASGAEGISALFALVSFGISIWAFVELGCLRGTVGPNNYGPDPLEQKF